MALFFASGIKCENHTAAIMLLKDVFGIDNFSIHFAKTERIDKQYYVDSSLVRDDVVALIRTAESFNAGILDATDRLTNEKIESFRAKLKKKCSDSHRYCTGSNLHQGIDPRCEGEKIAAGQPRRG